MSIAWELTKFEGISFHDGVHCTAGYWNVRGWRHAYDAAPRA